MPKPKGELTPKPDTTNGKATVGIKAENTEPNGTNIAGHNHSLNGTTRAEGSGFRAAPNNANFSYETSGTSLSSLVAGDELGYGKNVIIKVKYDTNAINRRDIGFTSTPNVGPRLDYTRKASDGIGPFEGGLNLKLVGIIPNDMIGTYDLHVHILNNKNNNSERATLKIPITVKPKKPTVSVADLEHAEGKSPVVTARVADATVSKAEFYLNNQKQATVEATRGIATWTPTAPLREHDIITVKNIAKGGIPPRDAYGNTFTVSEVSSDMSDAVIIPKAPKPAFDLEAAKSNAKASLAEAAKAEKAAIAADNSLTSAQRTAKEKEVDTTKAAEEAKITAADTADAVEAAKTAGVAAIKAVHTAGDLNAVKNAAKAALEEAAKAEKAEIAGDKSLTAAQRAEKEKAVDTTKAAEEAKITAADDADKVEVAKTAGVAAIKAVHTVGNLDDVKATAKALPNTGTAKSTLAIPVAITSALLSLGLVGVRRKEDEEG